MNSLLRCFLIMLIFLSGKETRAEELVTDISEHIVAIKSNFTGTQLLIFGAIETNSPESRSLERDVVLVVRGPSESLTMRKKGKKFGIWVNKEKAIYEKVPGFYSVASTKPLSLIAKNSVLERYQIGADNIRLKLTNNVYKTMGEDSKKALLRLKKEKKLYTEDTSGVSFLGDTLFRASLEIPATVPVGVYTAEVLLFRDGNVVHAQTTPLYVNKSGLESLLYSFAQRYSLYYGVLAVILALMAGWVAAILFRKN